jgi:hypothetical protein
MGGIVARLDTDTAGIDALIDRLAAAAVRIAELEARVEGLLDANNREVERRRKAERLVAEFTSAWRWLANISKPFEGVWNRSQLDRALRAAREAGL